jgi:hypothetical protein
MVRGVLFVNSRTLSPMFCITGIFKVVNEVHLAKAKAPMLVAAGKLTLVRAVQLEKALLPILVAAGKLTLVRAVQLEKALLPMLVADGKLTLSNVVQFEKAPLTIRVIVFRVILPEAEGNATSSLLFRTRALPFSITLKDPSPTRSNKTSEVQPVKTESPMFVVAGKLTLDRDVHHPKAWLFMIVAEGKLTLSRDMHPEKA